MLLLLTSRGVSNRTVSLVWMTTRSISATTKDPDPVSYSRRLEARSSDVFQCVLVLYCGVGRLIRSRLACSFLPFFPFPYKRCWSFAVIASILLMRNTSRLANIEADRSAAQRRQQERERKLGKSSTSVSAPALNEGAASSKLPMTIARAPLW